MTPTNQGMKTTEFYIGLIGVILVYLNKTLNLNLPSDQIMWISGMVITYILSRTIVKSKMISRGGMQ